MKLILLFLFIYGPAAHSILPRPPQYVMMAFDNCMDLNGWEQVSNELREINRQDPENLKFTFFLSAVGLVAHEKRHIYSPTKGKGRSNIGWGKSKKDVKKRIDFVNQLYWDGNEIASHAVGHFQGEDWTVEQWRAEFKAYRHIVDNVQAINQFKGRNGRLAFSANEIVGFRAPYLQAGKNALKVMMEYNTLYDTSDPDYYFSSNKLWPKKITVDGEPGPWNFGLGRIYSKMSKRKTLAMDYNFYVYDSNAEPVSKREAISFGDNMLDSYLEYFLGNYNNNRAPIHIGHHFHKYQQGEYNRALFQFAKLVCHLPEVECVTYSTYAHYMESLSSEQIKNYQRGNFPYSRPLTITQIKKNMSIASAYSKESNSEKYKIKKECYKRASLSWWSIKSDYTQENISRFYNKYFEIIDPGLRKKMISSFNQIKRPGITKEIMLNFCDKLSELY